MADDVPQPRQLCNREVRWAAEALPADDPDQAPIRIYPWRIAGWGIGTHPHARNSRSIAVGWRAAAAGTVR